MTEQDLASLLREIPVPPSRITTDHALSLGRKAVRRRRHGITAGAAVAVMAATTGAFALANPAPRPIPFSLSSPSPSTPAASPTPSAKASGWTATPLPLLDDKGAIVTAMDSSGRFIAGTTAGFRAILWENLSPRLLPPPSDKLDDLQVVDVNSAGVVVGDAMSDGSSGYAWVYRDGVTTKLPAPRAGGRYHARDLNDRGDILGWSERSGPILWPAGSPTAAPRTLSAVDDAFAIGDDGSVGGTTNDGDHPVIVSPSGQPRRLAELPGKPGGKVFAVSGNWAAGWVPAETDSRLMSALWNLATGELIPFPEVASFPVALSATGVIVASRTTFGSKVLVMPDGTIVPLAETPDPAPMRVNEIDAVAISADGTMVAGNHRPQAGPSPTPTPTLWRLTR